MATIKVEVSKDSGYTNKVLAHDGPSGLLIVDKEGAQEVVDHPRVRQLISTGVLKESTAKVEEEPEDPLAAQRQAEEEEAQRIAAENAKAEQERLDEEAKAEKARLAAEKKAAGK